MKQQKLTTATLCLAFLALGICLLLAAEQTLLAEGVSMCRVTLGEGRGTLFTPQLGEETSLLLPEEPSGGIHSHSQSVVLGGQCNAALLLGDGVDGQHALATELARRGVAVLLPDRKVPARTAWDWLMDQEYTRAACVALIASKRCADDALALGTALSATDRAPAATILLGDDDTLLLAADYPGLDLLILTGKAPGEEARRAYFGENYGPEREFTGYYGDGTARAAAPARGRLAFSSRATMQRILDWQGSALGHAVEIPDDDEIFRRIDAYRIAAVFCVAAAGLIWPLRRKRL